MNAGDLLYILFLVVCVLLAIYLSDDGDGGGKRAKVPV